MAHKTFISYKYSDARFLRDRIIRSLGADAKYYNGEDGYSDDMSSLKASTIKKKLADMMFDTSVTIVIISPQMKASHWIEWEIEYCLKNISRKDRTSHMNGIVGVIMKVNGSYDWFVNHFTNCHGISVVNHKNEYLYPIIYDNHFNSVPPKWHCNMCKTYDWLWGSYIEYVEEDTFLANPQYYISNAYEKSENDGVGYEIHPLQ